MTASCYISSSQSLGKSGPNRFILEYDADGNATLIQTGTGTWQISYNGENRPVRFENFPVAPVFPAE